MRDFFRPQPDRMRKNYFPDSLVLIFGFIVFAQVLTYVIPAGEFDRVPVPRPTDTATRVTLPRDRGILTDQGDELLEEGNRTIVLPPGTYEEVPGRMVIQGSYHPVDADPLPWHASLTRIPAGLAAAADIIFFVFIVGGVIAVIRRTGAIDALIGTAIKRLGHNPILLISGMLVLFGIGSSTIGMAEEYMPFVPILVAMCLALRMDAIVALGIVYIGAGVGYGCASLNPFTVMIAKDIAGQDPGFALWPRWALLFLLLGIGTHHLLKYARKVQANPAASLVADVDYSDGFEIPEDVKLTGRRVLILAVFVCMIGLFVWGVTAHDWYLVELSALFLGAGLLSAILGGVPSNETARVFTRGTAEMAGTAILIGFARTIEVVLSDGQVIDTVIHGIATALSHTEVFGQFAPVVSSWGMLAVQSFINLLIPSGSGQAYVTMPIMAPLADLTGIGRETAVLAFQFGDGFTNMIVPTNALLMGMLLLGRIPYQRWIRFILPFIGKIYVVCLIVLAIAASMQLQ